MQCVQVDLMGPFQQSASGNKYIFAMVDLMTRYTILRAIPNKEAKTIIKVFDDIISLYGCMLSVQSDCGSEFKNNQLQTFFDKLKIAKKFSTPHRPTSNSLVERTNGKILRFLKYFETSGTDWDENLNCVSFAINNSINKHLGMTSHEAFHGWKILFPSFLTQNKVSLLNNNDLRDINYDIARKIGKHRKLLAKLYENELSRKENLVTEHNDLKVGTHVLFKFDRPVGSSKLFQCWKGLYRIKKVLDNDSYLITNVNDSRKDYIVFRPRLKVFGPVNNDSTECKTNGTRPDQTLLSNGQEPDQKCLTEGKDPDLNSDNINKNKISPKNPYNLRREKTVDYRPYFDL